MRVALDVTPLLGTRSGVAAVVEGLLGALASTEDPPEISTWTMSGRNRSDGGVGAIPLALPAAIAVPLWTRIGRPRVDARLGRPDIIHGTNYVVPPSRAASLVSVYDLSFIHDAVSTSRSVRRFDSMARSAVGRGAVIHTTAAVVADELRDRYGARVEVVPPGIVARPLRVEPTGPAYIAAVGTAVRRKSFPLLVEAFGQLASDRPELELRLAGAAGPDSSAIEEAILALPDRVRGRVRHLGRIGDSELLRLVEGAALLAHPSRYEGFGLPILEAMSAGVPVVAANAGSVPEVAGGAALLVPAGDTDAMAAAMAKVLDDDAFAATLALSGPARSASFTWERSAAEMMDLYQRLLD